MNNYAPPAAPNRHACYDAADPATVVIASPDDATPRLTGLAHDMRVSLAVIRNAAHLLTLRRDFNAVESVRRIVLRQADRLARLADELAAPAGP